MIIPMSSKSAREVGPEHINPMQWHQSVGYARQACARIFRDGGQPEDAIKAFGLKGASGGCWSKAVEMIAEQLSAVISRKAA